MTPPLVFIDTETTGLDPDTHELWEIALIRRGDDGTDWEHLWQIRKAELHLIQSADPEALNINRYHERMIVPNDFYCAQIDGDGRPVGMSHDTLVYDLTKLLDGAVLIGSNPAFDAAFLRYFLDASPWHYRPIDIATLCAGWLHGSAWPDTAPDDARQLAALSLPYSSRALSLAVGVEPPRPGVAHTALGDARWARDVYDAITWGAK